MRVALVGLGPIGIEVARALRSASGMTVTAAADPAHAGADLATLAGGDSLTIAPAADEAYRRGADVAVLCTGSRVPAVVGQIEEAIAAGLHVVSTCEELSYPWLRHAALADRIDVLAKARGVVVLGTGVNPGLVMDRLPWVIAQGCITVEHILVTRTVDVARRRAPLQAKVGAGLTVAELEDGLASGRLGHVGLGESAALLAISLGFAVAGVDETAAPVVDATSGRALGIRQSARVLDGAIERVRLELAMYTGADPADRIVVKGDPPLDVRVIGGYQGDRATVGAVVSALRRVRQLAPGMRTAIQA